MKRGLPSLAVLMLLTGALAVYLGLGIMRTGGDVSGTGGAFGNELEVLGGLWSALGAVLAMMGALCFPLALGTAALREWGRKNGMIVTLPISALATIAGFLVAYFDLLESPGYFVLAVLAAVCGVMLGRWKEIFELGTGITRKAASPPAPGYREVRQVRRKIIMRQARTAGGMRSRPMVKCPRCGTMNRPERTHCMTCGREL